MTWVLAVQGKIICAVGVSIYVSLLKPCLLVKKRNQVVFVVSLYFVRLNKIRLLQNIVHFAALTNVCGQYELDKTFHALFTLSWLGIQSANQVL